MLWRITHLNETKLRAKLSIEYLSKCDIFLKASMVMAYYPTFYELAFIFELINRFPTKKYYFPKIMGNNLIFYQATNPTNFETHGRLKVFEPKAIGQSLELKEDLAKVIAFIPSVGIDRKLNRLGQGKGFYDRFLTQSSSCLKTVSIIPDFALFRGEMPVDGWDRKLKSALVVGLNEVEFID
ncbi:MAG: hypothetical protein JJV97_06535 [SAR324 cluster bacterium]|nr:hypothetical protein [SAR324 cluster bacterium]